MGNISQSLTKMGQGAPNDLSLHPLTLQQTFALWGGLHVPRLSGTILQVKDVTQIALDLAYMLPTTSKVACVHLSTFKPCLAQLRPGGKAQYMRALMDARQALVAQGFTHVALTGPMLRTLKLKPRLRAVAQYRTHQLIATPVAIGVWLSYGVVLLAAKAWGRDRALINGMGRTRRAVMVGFSSYVIYAL